MAHLAGLPMYEIEATRGATDELWHGLARAFRDAGIEDVPDALDRALDAEALWRDPGLLFAQTCGYPLTHALKGRVRVVGTPCYRAPACAGPLYASLLVVRHDDPARRIADLGAVGRVAINALASHSGHHALRAALAAAGRRGRLFEETVITGSHLRSLDAVRDGAADVAAIDAVIFGLLERHEPGRLEGVRIVGSSPAAPGLPFITARGTDGAGLARLRVAVRRALADPGLAAARAALLLDHVAVLPDDAYGRILELERLGRRIALPAPAA